jgi:hypothetical protein
MTTTSKTKIVEPDYTEKMKGFVSKYGETIAQGMAFALGGLIVNGMASKYRTHKQTQLIASEENVLTFDKTANS